MFPHGIDDECDALRLAGKTVGEFSAHDDGGVLAFTRVAPEHPGERRFSPERAVMDMGTRTVDDFEVGAADVDPDHSRSSLPSLSNLTRPERWTDAGAFPYEASTRTRAISSSMQAAIPTILVVGLGLTSTT